MAQYGLLGGALGHSYSPEIHKAFGSWPYELFQTELCNLETFVRWGPWDGLNVTIPYKKAVLPFCQELSEIAQALGSVNTLIRKPGGHIYGDNTDAFGFMAICRRMNVEFSGKKALVLGSGGSSVTVQWVLKELGCNVTVISRHGPNHYGNLELHKDASLLVNTTPLGMYPQNEACPISLALFPKLEAVLDLIYNPFRTRLVLQAQERGIPWASGLYMLVAQAAKSSALFTGSEISGAQIDAVFRSLCAQTRNLILIGMPGCGKSTIGQLLAMRLNRPFYDADQELACEVGMSAENYLRTFGEAAFRKMESQVLKELGALSGVVIATGGGCVTQTENEPLLRQNGTVIWLQRDLSLLPSQGRPLSCSHGIDVLFFQRELLYRHFADITVCNDGPPEETCAAIMEAWMQ